MNDGGHRTQGTGNDEWYTPYQYIESARHVMGSIEFDPASNDYAQATVMAHRYMTVEDDSLKHPEAWHGNVWMNPPYSKGKFDQFIRMLVVHYLWGNVQQAIVLAHNTTDTAASSLAIGSCDAFCLTDHRVKFYGPDGASAKGVANGQIFYYFGSGKKRFANEYCKYGNICSVMRAASKFVSTEKMVPLKLGHLGLDIQ